jgi:hypothetical protein
MPYRKKHFLETSPKEREFRQAMDMKRNGRDAIDGYYPEATLLPFGKVPNVMRNGGAISRVKPDSAVGDAKEAVNKVKHDVVLRQIVEEKPKEEKEYKRGGSVRGDGIAKRGKTKGRFV